MKRRVFYLLNSVRQGKTEAIITRPNSASGGRQRVQQASPVSDKDIHLYRY